MLLYLGGLLLYAGLLAGLVRLLPQPVPPRLLVPLYAAAALVLLVSPGFYLLADLSWRLPVPSLCALSIGLLSGVPAWRKLAGARRLSFGAVVTLAVGLLSPVLFRGIWQPDNTFVYQDNELTVRLENYYYSGFAYDKHDFDGCKQLVAYKHQLLFWDKQVGQQVVCPQGANGLEYSAALSTLVKRSKYGPIVWK